MLISQIYVYFKNKLDNLFFFKKKGDNIKNILKEKKNCIILGNQLITKLNITNFISNLLYYNYVFF